MIVADTDSELDDLERFLRAKWIDGAKPASVLAEDDRAVAEKLLGKSQAGRLAATTRGERFKYRPERIAKIEYFYVPPDLSGVAKSGWTIEVFANGTKRVFARGLDDPFCAFAIRELTARQYSCLLVRTEAMRQRGISSPIEKARRPPHRASQPIEPKRPPAVAQQPRSRKFAIMDQLRSFRR